MEKLQQLIETCPDELFDIVNKLYDEKFPKKKKNSKTIFKFKVLGKNYDSTITTKNYVSFISDISKIHPFEMFKECIHEYYLSNNDLVLKQSQKINDNFYISGYSSTEVKVRHVMNICELLGINLEIL
jgi:hypothetical protein